MTHHEASHAAAGVAVISSTCTVALVAWKKFLNCGIVAVASRCSVE
jgi:hypothetical protein